MMRFSGKLGILKFFVRWIIVVNFLLETKMKGRFCHDIRETLNIRNILTKNVGFMSYDEFCGEFWHNKWRVLWWTLKLTTCFNWRFSSKTFKAFKTCSFKSVGFIKIIINWKILEKLFISTLVHSKTSLAV